MPAEGSNDGLYSPVKSPYSPTANGPYSPANGPYTPAKGPYTPANGPYMPANGPYTPANGRPVRVKLEDVLSELPPHVLGEYTWILLHFLLILIPLKSFHIN